VDDDSMSELPAGGGEPAPQGAGPGEPGGPTSAASIVAAAERLAAEITRSARADADAIRARAGSDSDTARAATAERVRRLSALAGGMLERLGEMRAQLDGLARSLVEEGASETAAATATPEAAGGAARAAVGGGALEAAGGGAEPAAPSTAPVGVDDAGARLIALNLALSDTPRDEAVRQLRDQVPDPERLVDEVYASVDR
jgi:hypothetical protein